MNLDLKEIVSLIFVVTRLPSLQMAHFHLVIYDLIGGWLNKCTRALEPHHRLRPSVFMLSYNLMTPVLCIFRPQLIAPNCTKQLPSCEAPFFLQSIEYRIHIILPLPFFHFSLGDPTQSEYPMPRKPRYLWWAISLSRISWQRAFSVFSFESHSFTDRTRKGRVIPNVTFLFKLWLA